MNTIMFVWKGEMSYARAVRIDLARARTVVDRAIAHARSNDFPPMTVAVLDAARRLVAFAGEDGSSLLRERIARGKAHRALNMVNNATTASVSRHAQCHHIIGPPHHIHGTPGAV